MRPPIAEPARPASAANLNSPALAPPSTERWNFWGLAFYQVLLRIGWIFKTESVVMPAVLDALGASPMLRGFQPLLNRFGQSVPPLLMSRRIRGAKHKKWFLAACAALMAATFFLLSFLWLQWGAAGAAWLPHAFLGLYALFFVVTGVHQLCLATLTGKLVFATRRGRLMMAASVVGAVCACLCAWVLLPRWLESDGGRFEYIFGFTGACFLLAAIWALMLKETPDNYQQRSSSLRRLFVAARRILRRDRNFRQLACVALLFGFSVMLFPHYQALGRERLGLSFENLMVWVVVQNAGTALFSVIAGPLADWRGNRLVLLLVLLAICAAPLAAIALSYSPSWGPALFPLIFLAVGLTPNAIRTISNYTLEICSPSDHPLYLSTISIFIAAPALLSPLIGWLIGVLGFDAVFLTLTALIFGGWLSAFGLNEPRTAKTA